MSITIDTARRTQLASCLKSLERGATLEHALGMAWNYGFTEGDRDTETLELEFERRIHEINNDPEAV